jgi:hypothetical protein
MAIIGRLNKLEEKMKPIEDEIERKKEELKSKEEIFYSLNQAIEEYFPTNQWCKLLLKERKRLYFSEPQGTYDYTNRLLPKFIPFDKGEFDLLGEVIDLYANIIQREILRRRELKRGKIKNN